MSYKSGIMPLKQVRKPPFTIESPGYDEVPGETKPRRHPRAKDGLITSPAEGVNTVFDIIKRSASVWPDGQAVGSRKLIQMHTETKKVQKNIDGEVQEVEKKWQLFELSPFTFMTYKDYLQYALDLGAGLRKLGLAAGDRLHLYAATRYVNPFSRFRLSGCCAACPCWCSSACQPSLSSSPRAIRL